MKIEIGKFYKTRDGRKVGPMRFSMSGDDLFSQDGGDLDGCLWGHNGKRRLNGNTETDIIAEWTDAPDLSNPLGQVFSLMPPETQEAMKAHGGPWQWYLEGSEWEDCDGPFHDWRAYRVKPAPIRETMTLTGGEANGWGFYVDGGVSNAFSITFDLIDGKPDCASIKMERL